MSISKNMRQSHFPPYSPLVPAGFTSVAVTLAKILHQLRVYMEVRMAALTQVLRVEL